MGQLHWAGLVKNPSIAADGPERGEIWLEMAKAVKETLERCNPEGYRAHIRLVSEIPIVRQRGSGKGDPNDLIDLAGVVGAICGALGSSNHFLLDVEWTPIPEQWKGQLPKEVSKQRVDAALSPEEFSRVEWPAEKLKHNVYDAIHLGLTHLKREGLRVVVK